MQIQIRSQDLKIDWYSVLTEYGLRSINYNTKKGNATGL